MSSTHMKMMIGLRRLRTTIPAKRKSAAVRASDSASTGGPPPSENHRSSYRHQKKYARQFERQQVVLEERLRYHAHGVQLLKLLLVEVARYDPVSYTHLTLPTNR